MIYVLSGGGNAKAYAVIGVTYPAGSVCTCSDGSKTLKLKDTSGQGFFLIPFAGTWTVTATDGEYTRSESFQITSEGQSEKIELMFRTYLFASGEGAKIALFKSGYPPETTVLITDEKIELIGNSSYGGRAVYSNAKIDLTKYSKLWVDGEIYSATGTIPEYVGISSDKPSDSSQPSDTYGSGKAYRIAYQEMATERSLTYLDISSYSGLYYVLIGGMNRAYIYNWWLE